MTPEEVEDKLKEHDEKANEGYEGNFGYLCLECYIGLREEEEIQDK